MKITLHGAAGEVTGSAYLVETDRARVLVDFGLFQGGPRREAKNVIPPGLEPHRLDAVLVTLVDVPLIGADAVRLLLARAAVSTAPVLRAVHLGRHGHPVIFKRELFEALRRADPAAGAKTVVRAVQVEDVETGDPGVVEDVDTPEEYARLFGIR